MAHSNKKPNEQPHPVRKRVRPKQSVCPEKSRRIRRANEARRVAAPAAPKYEVGYKKPPKSTQFQPGQSGNPKGRPHKPKPTSIKAIITQELMTEMTITENGKKIRLTAIQVAVRRLTVEAAKGSVTAIRHLTKLGIQFMTSGADDIILTPEQEELLSRLLDDE